MKKCEKCGKEYMMQSCEFCKRLELWEKTKQKTFIEKTFPLRIQEEVLKFNFELGKLQEADNLYLFGGVKSGKTLLSARLVLEAKQQSFLKNDVFSVGFYNTQDILFSLKECYNVQGRSELKVIQFYRDLGFLVFDDIGEGKLTDWYGEMMYAIINYRYEWKKRTIYTSNFSVKELAEALGNDRIASRIERSCVILKLNSK
jgi:DNA replication protein DnaC